MATGGNVHNKLEIFYQGMVFDDFFFAYYFYVTIPYDYDHMHQLRAFCDRFGFGKPLTSIFTEERFAHVTHKLIPGETYMLKVFLATKKKSFDECLEFAKSQKNTVFTGIQGLLFLMKEHFLQLPIGSAAFSLDEKDALGVFSSHIPVLPCVCRHLDGKLSFVLTEADAITQHCCLLCFTEETRIDEHDTQY